MVLRRPETSATGIDYMSREIPNVKDTHQTTHSIQLYGVMTAVSLTSYALRNDDGN